MDRETHSSSRDTTTRKIHNYLSTRFSSLVRSGDLLQSPFKVLSGLNRHQWRLFAAGALCGLCDSFDFFSVSLTVPQIAYDFGVLPSAVSWGITLTLMLRFVGALGCGVIADSYVRRVVMLGTMGLFIVLEMFTGFCKALTQFLAVRALWGLSMRGGSGDFLPDKALTL